MKNRFLILVLGLVFLLSFVAPAVAEDKEAKQTRITGYSQYELGALVSELKLEGFVGPVEDPSYEGLTGVKNYAKEEKVYFAGRGTEVRLVLQTLEGRIEGISMDFTNLLEEFKELDHIGYYVKDLRQLIVERYDPKLKKWDDFFYTYSSYGGNGWLGLLELKDEVGNTLILMWSGYSLDLIYKSARLQEVIDAAKKKVKEKSEGKL